MSDQTSEILAMAFSLFDIVTRAARHAIESGDPADLRKVYDRVTDRSAIDDVLDAGTEAAREIEQDGR